MPEQFERKWRANLARQVGAEDPLSELERFLKSATHPPNSPPASEPILRTPSPLGDEPRRSQQPLHIEARQQTTYRARAGASDRRRVAEAQPSDLRDTVGQEHNLATSSTHFLWRRWKMMVSGVAFGVVTVISAGFALKREVPGPPQSPLFVDATEGPISVRPSNEEEVPTLRDAGDLLQPEHLQGGNLPTELEENTAVAKKSSTPSVASVDGPRTAVEATSGAAVATTTVDASAVANSAASPPMVSSRTTSLGPVRNAELIVSRTVRAKTNAMAEASSQTLQPESPSARATSLSSAPILPTVSGQQLGGVVWSVQLAAAESETEAERDATRLETRYTSALNGRMIEVQKAVVGGESIYRVRVVGLSKADATASCAHVKRDGGECYIVK